MTELESQLGISSKSPDEAAKPRSKSLGKGDGIKLGFGKAKKTTSAMDIHKAFISKDGKEKKEKKKGSKKEKKKKKKEPKTPESV